MSVFKSTVQGILSRLPALPQFADSFADAGGTLYTANIRTPIPPVAPPRPSSPCPQRPRPKLCPLQGGRPRRMVDARGQEPGLDSDSSEGFPTGWPRPLLRQFSFSSAWGYSPHSPKHGVAFRTPYSVPSVQICVWGHLPGTPPNTANI